MAYNVAHLLPIILGLMCIGTTEVESTGNHSLQHCYLEPASLILRIMHNFLTIHVAQIVASLAP